MTYAHDRRVIRHLRRLALFRCGCLDDVQLLHIAATEDDVFVDLVGAGNLLVRVAFTALGTVRLDIFEGDCRLLAVDLVQHADVFDVGL